MALLCADILTNIQYIILIILINMINQQTLISEILFYNIAFLSTADDKVIYAESVVYFHDTPEDGFMPNLDHWFWNSNSFFTYSSS
jgi:hypothetical protein